MSQAGRECSAPNLGAFQDQRVFLARPGDRRLAMHWDAKGGFEQCCDGPTFVVIGVDTSDEKCAGLARRFGLPLADILAFRAATAAH